MLNIFICTNANAIPIFNNCSKLKQNNQFFPFTGSAFTVYIAPCLSRAEIKNGSIYIGDEDLLYASRLSGPRDWERCVTGRMLLRIALTGKTSGAIEPANWRFTAGACGKPGVSFPDISFNVSHSEDAVAVAISSAGSIGVDIERLDAFGSKTPSEDLRRFVLSPAEKEWIGNQKPSDKAACFVK